MESQLQAPAKQEAAKKPLQPEAAIKAKAEAFRAGFSLGRAMGEEELAACLGIKGEASFERAWAEFLRLKPSHSRKKRSGFFFRSLKAIQGALLPQDKAPGNCFSSRAFFAGQELRRAWEAKEAKANLGNICQAAESLGGLPGNSSQSKDRAKEAAKALEGYQEGRLWAEADRAKAKESEAEAKAKEKEEKAKEEAEAKAKEAEAEAKAPKRRSQKPKPKRLEAAKA